MALISDILDRIRRQQPDYKRAASAVAEAVLADPEAAAQMSVQALAERAGVSEPTVVRFAVGLGCDGFKDFKDRLTRDLIVGRVYNDVDRIMAESDPRNLADRVLKAGIQAMETARGQLDLNDLLRAARAIHKARQVYCFGVGGSSVVMAEEAENRLFRLRIPVQATGDSYRQRMIAAICRKDDLIVYFSATGRPRPLLESAEIAMDGGATTIAVTPADSPLSNRCSITLALAVPDDELFFNLPARVRYGQLFILDSLAAAVAAEVGAASAQQLRAIRSALAALHGLVDGQPIGD